MSDADALKARRAPRPLDTVTIPVEAWHVDYQGRRSAPELAGLRLLSEQDKQEIRREAIRYAVESHPDVDGLRIEAFNDRLIACGVGRALCNPNNATKLFFDFPDDQAPRAFTTSFMRHVWERLGRIEISCAISEKELSDEQLPALIELLTPARLALVLPAPRQRRLRKLLSFALSELKQGT